MKSVSSKIIMITCTMLCSAVYANLQPSVITTDCQQIQMQCKNNEISASDCVQKIEACVQQAAQNRAQQIAPQKTNNNAVRTPPQQNIMTDGQPEAPVDDGKTGTATPTTNPHPDWHFGN